MMISYADGVAFVVDIFRWVRMAMFAGVTGVALVGGCGNPGDGTSPDGGPASTICSAFTAGCSTDPGPRAPFAIDFGEFNGDGAVDLVVANSDSNSLSLLFGVGDGTFLPSVDVPVGSGIFGPQGVVAVDFDGDGDDDLAATTGEEGDQGLSILTNDGGGSFTRTGRFDGGSAVSGRIVPGDINNDGDIDLVIINGICLETAVLLGRGDGGFDEPTLLTGAACPRSAALGDLDGDGLLDLVVTSNDIIDFGVDEVSVYLNLGGAFTLLSSLQAREGPEAVVIEDFDGDGDLDIAVSHGRSNDVALLLNDGTAAFALGGVFEARVAPTSMIAGDLDGDGDVDIATANSANNSVSVLLNLGGATFAESREFEIGGRWPMDIAAVDLDGDGDLDLATANNATNNGSVLLNDGSGSFALVR
jgi:hypothetical protein